MTPLFATMLREETVRAAFLAVSAAMWAWICARWRQRKPVLPWAWRRPVPWQTQDVLFLFLIGLYLPVLATEAVHAWMGPEAAQPPAGQKPELAHPAEQLLRAGTPGEKAIAVVTAVIVAPLFDELFFRVLLQGWLESVWHRRRRKHPELRSAPVSWLPIVLPAALFALMHVRSGREPVLKEYLSVLFLAQIAADLLVLGLAIGLLRFAAGATAADLGWKPEKLRSDARLGLLALLATIGPVLTLQVVLIGLVKRTGIDYAPDPIPLFFLALVFGVLYHRTHRLAPSLVLHMTFNATAVIGLLVGG